VVATGVPFFRHGAVTSVRFVAVERAARVSVGDLGAASLDNEPVGNRFVGDEACGSFPEPADSGMQPAALRKLVDPLEALDPGLSVDYLQTLN
jgi:hypothetical protein